MISILLSFTEIVVKESVSPFSPVTRPLTSVALAEQNRKRRNPVMKYFLNKIEN
jgi:hypothetical protein